MDEAEMASEEVKNAKKYRLTIPLVQNLPLTSKQEFHFGLARSGQARTGQAKVELLF